MKRSLVLLAGLSGALPLSFEIPGPVDSTSSSTAFHTRVRVAGGAGTYSFIVRGCEGQVIDHVSSHFRDGSVSIEHRPGTSPIALGVRGGWIRDRIDTSATPERFANVPLGRTTGNRYVNPYLAFDPGPMGVGLGMVFHDREFITAGEHAREQADHPLNDFSGHLRIGALQKKYVELSWMESEPLYSGGGYLTLGLGGGTRDGRLSVFAGLGGGPYEGIAPMARAGYSLTPWVRMHVAAHAADAASLGLELRIPSR
jgi:hypothetical protein